MTFHSIILLFNIVTLLSEALRYYREAPPPRRGDPLPKGSPKAIMKADLTSRQAAIVGAAFFILLLDVIPSRETKTLAIALLILPFFTWSMYRWKDRFHDLGIFLLTK